MCRVLLKFQGFTNNTNAMVESFYSNLLGDMSQIINTSPVEMR